MRTSISLSMLGAAALAVVAGCTVKDIDQPALAGPSTLATSIVLKASPDTLIQDGASQSLITITAIDAHGSPKNIPLRAEISIDGVVQDFGRLSTKQPVANGAPLIYTSPTSSTLAAGQVAQTVTILISPTDGNAFDGRGEIARQVDIRLVPQGVVLPTNPTLVAAFTVNPATPQAFQTVTFDASTTTNNSVACGNACSYSWNFGDGTTGSGITTTHVFRSVASASVTLTVTDTRGAQNTTTKSLTPVNPTQPTGDFTTSPTSGFTTNVDIFFNASLVRWAGRTITSYQWNFGDGTSGSGVTTTHRYSGVGTYNVVLTLTDDLGATGQVSPHPITVTTNGGVTANLTASTTAPQVGQRVVFDATTSVPSTGATIVSYRFIYGDGGEEESTNGIQSHTYTSTGPFAATVIVTDSNGKTASRSLAMTVS